MLAPITLPGVVQQSKLSGPCFCQVPHHSAAAVEGVWSEIGLPSSALRWIQVGMLEISKELLEANSKPSAIPQIREMLRRSEKIIKAQLLKHDADNRVSQEGSNANSQRSGSTLSAIVVSLIVLTVPGPTLTNSTVTLSDTERADQLGQLRQAASILEKAAESLDKVRFDGTAGLQVLDKAVTVVTGSTFVDPKVLDEEVDGLLSGKVSKFSAVRRTFSKKNRMELEVQPSI
ncbi:unnamed protein product [Calypogeia fissa]